MLTESYQQFCNQVPEALHRFEKLNQRTGQDGKVFIRGEIDIVDKSSHYWESYDVEIHHVDGFPFKFPNVYEVGGKIPRIADWHVNEDSYTCCLTVPPLEMIKCNKGIRLVSFIEHEVLPYFFNQTHRREEGYYAKGEYSHGYVGILEFFESELRTEGDVRATINILFKIAFGRKPDRTHNCFCGKKVKFRKCHRVAYDRLIILGKEQLVKFANYIAEQTENNDLIQK